MSGPRVWRVLLTAAFIAACGLLPLGLPQASAQAPPDKPVVYNHIAGAATDMDRLAHQTYETDFKVVDIRSQDGAYSPPTLKMAPQPKAPGDISGKPITGTVVVFFIVTAEGKVAKPVIINSTDRRLNLRVLETLAQWTFEPAQLNGKSVASIGGQEFKIGAEQ
jgi:TonB family protein